MSNQESCCTRTAQLRTLVLMATLTLAPLAVRAGSYECLIVPAQEVEMRGSVVALIEKIHVQRGEDVRKGQVLVELEASAERSSMEAARYRTQMDGRITTARSRLEFATRKFERMDGLSKKRYVAAQLRDEAQTEQQLAQSELQDAIESQELARREYLHARDIVNLRVLRSPFDGVVVERSLNPGDLTESGNARKPILKLARIDPLIVEVILPLDAHGRIKPGMTGIVTPEKLGGSYTATVKLIDRVVDAASGTFGIRLEMPNHGRAVPGGLRCQVDFPTLKSVAPLETPTRPTAAGTMKARPK